MANRQDAHYSRGPMALGLPFRAEIVFDGTKLPLVVRPSQNHIPWYEIAFSPLFDQSESRHFAILANENRARLPQWIEFIRDGLI
jgi:hypothetical protein